jgi:hypothetical protein
VLNYRTPIERAARSSRLTKKAVREQTRQQLALWRLQMEQDRAFHAQNVDYQQAQLMQFASAQPASAGWYHCQSDPPTIKRWWNGREWTPDTMAHYPSH